MPTFPPFNKFNLSHFSSRLLNLHKVWSWQGWSGKKCNKRYQFTTKVPGSIVYCIFTTYSSIIHTKSDNLIMNEVLKYPTFLEISQISSVEISQISSVIKKYGVFLDLKTKNMPRIHTFQNHHHSYLFDHFLWTRFCH